jgi:TonB-linked SusC/RagA family outer membrane protein
MGIFITKKHMTMVFTLLSVIILPLKAQQRSVQGTVMSASDGATLPGVTVVVKDYENVGTVTDFEGRFSVNLPEEATALVFSFIGMETQTVTIGNSNQINVALEPSTSSLDEVVVTALGISRDVRSIGFSSQEIGEEALSASREPSISSYLTGKVSGVQISKTAGGAGSSTNVIIRGYGSISGNNQPLWVVDGVPINNFSNSSGGSGVASADIDYGDGIGELNPQDVESMNVLKGPSATALYGSRGANGVIIVTTKSGKGKKGVEVEVNSGLTFDELNLLPKYQNQFAAGYGDEGYANYSWMTFEDENGVKYPYPENGFLDSWGGPLDGSILIPNWWTLPDDGSIPTSVWDNPVHEVIPMVAQPADNVRDFFDRGQTLSNNVALTASDGNSSMRLSLGNRTTKGIVPNHEVKNTTVSFNGATQVGERLSFDGKVNYIRSEGSQRPATGFSSSNPFFTLTSMPRFTPLDFIKHQYEVTKVNIRYPGIDYNPYFIVNEVKNNDFKDRVVANASATVRITDWLSLMGRVGVDFYSEMRENTWPLDPESKNTASRLGQMIQQMRRARDLNADIMLRAAKDFSENFSVSGVLGANMRSFRQDNMRWDARQFKSTGVYHISNFHDIRPSSSLYEKEMQSVFFTGQVAYKDFLFLDVTGRNDWSSALGVDHQSFFYPSVSSSFVFTDGLNIQSDMLSFGKIRASWAQVGNDSDPYLTRAGYSLANTGFNGQSLASKSGTLPLWNLRNELSESVEFGADLRFFNDRAHLDVTYYDAVTSNQILNLPVSSSSGYSSAVINAGEIRNNGLEITLGVTPVQVRDFKWIIDANFADNQSEVVVLDGIVQTYNLIQNGGDLALSDIHAQVGAPYGNIIGRAYKRAPDGRKIVSSAGRYVPEDELSVIGNITPDWIGGLNNTFSYRGFTLNVLVDFVQGGDIVSATKYHMQRKGTGAWTVEGRRPKARYDETDVIPEGSQVGDAMPYVGVLDGVIEVKDAEGNVIGYEENTQAVPGSSYWANRGWDGIGEEFIEDGSYISLREVMLQYRFQPRIISKTPFKAATLTVFGRNLAYLKNGMDYLGLSPESAPNTAGGASGIEALAVPSTRSYGFNVRLTF